MGILSTVDRSAMENDPKKAGEAMESLLLQRMLSTVHFMGKSSAPGAGMRNDLFVEALSDAVTKSGGMGLAAELTGQKAPAKSAEGEENGSSEKNKLQPNPSNSGGDLETQLLSHRPGLIGIGKRTDNSLGDP